MPIKPEIKKLYPKNWAEISKYIRFVRAKNRCEFCGAENYSPHPITKSRVVLSVAHLDHNPQNNNEDNLRALCQRCHLACDRKQHVMSAKITRKANGEKMQKIKKELKKRIDGSDSMKEAENKHLIEITEDGIERFCKIIASTLYYSRYSSNRTKDIVFREKYISYNGSDKNLFFEKISDYRYRVVAIIGKNGIVFNCYDGVGEKKNGKKASEYVKQLDCLTDIYETCKK